MFPDRTLRAACACLLLSLCLAATASATAPGTGRLRIIHLDVGQGDGAVLITPNGQVAMFDDGTGGLGAMGVSVPNQLKALGVTGIEHHFCSHYHADHIGGTPSIVAAGIPILNGWDRGGSYTTATYTKYVTALGAGRKTILKGQVITLDSLSAHPVILKCVDLGTAGINPGSTEENNQSMVVKVSYGEFDMVFGGDLPGQNSSPYINVESTIGPGVGHVEIYKVHHHGSATSSWDDWLNATTPQVAVISCGNGNTYGHPTAAALGRLHAHGVKTYWTETGSGVAPLAGWDKVANGQIAISATWMGAGVDTISGNGFVDTIVNSGTAPDLTPPSVTLLSPLGGGTLVPGDACTIAWTATDDAGVDSVNVDASYTGAAGPWVALAHGLANTGSWTWTVPDVVTDSAFVRVTALDHALNAGVATSDSAFAIGAQSAGVIGGPARLALAPPAPNPSAGNVGLAFSLPAEGAVRLEVMDAMGRRVGGFSGVLAAGPHSWTWDGRDVHGTPAGPGIYLVRLGTAQGTRTRRLVLLR